jgi:hypothetical protein
LYFCTIACEELPKKNYALLDVFYSLEASRDGFYVKLRVNAIDFQHYMSTIQQKSYSYILHSVYGLIKDAAPKTLAMHVHLKDALRATEWPTSQHSHLKEAPGTPGISKAISTIRFSLKC